MQQNTDPIGSCYPVPISDTFFSNFSLLNGYKWMILRGWIFGTSQITLMNIHFSQKLIYILFYMCCTTPLYLLSSADVCCIVHLRNFSYDIQSFCVGPIFGTLFLNFPFERWFFLPFLCVLSYLWCSQCWNVRNMQSRNYRFSTRTAPPSCPGSTLGTPSKIPFCTGTPSFLPEIPIPVPAPAPLPDVSSCLSFVHPFAGGSRCVLAVGPIGG